MSPRPTRPRRLAIYLVREYELKPERKGLPEGRLGFDLRLGYRCDDEICQAEIDSNFKALYLECVGDGARAAAPDVGERMESGVDHLRGSLRGSFPADIRQSASDEDLVSPQGRAGSVRGGGQGRALHAVAEITLKNGWLVIWEMTGEMT